MSMPVSDLVHSHADPLTFGCFEVGGHTYAVTAAQIREVVRFQTITPLPQSPPLIEGVIDLRGTIVPVLDLGRVLAGTPVSGDGRARIAIAQSEGRVVGLAVEAAVSVVSLEEDQLETTPELAHGEACLTRAVARRDGAEPILVLSLEELLRRVQESGDGPACGEERS
jgi:purine-binding chemotaxis protein CheW